MHSRDEKAIRLVLVLLGFFYISEEYMVCRILNKLHPHIDDTHRFNSVSEQLHATCLQSHIKLNAHLKHL